MIFFLSFSSYLSTTDLLYPLLRAQMSSPRSYLKSLMGTDRLFSILLLSSIYLVYPFSHLSGYRYFYSALDYFHGVYELFRFFIFPL